VPPATHSCTLYCFPEERDWFDCDHIGIPPVAFTRTEAVVWNLTMFPKRKSSFIHHWTMAIHKCKIRIGWKHLLFVVFDKCWFENITLYDANPHTPLSSLILIVSNLGKASISNSTFYKNDVRCALCWQDSPVLISYWGSFSPSEPTLADALDAAVRLETNCFIENKAMHR
jgi:hypothetical protein